MTQKPKIKISLRLHFADGEMLSVSDAQETALFEKCADENSVVFRLEQAMLKKSCVQMFDRVMNFGYVTNTYFHVEELESEE